VYVGENLAGEVQMATGKELRIWAATVRKWAADTADPETRKHMLQLATELDELARLKEAGDRQLA
jgi:hypothetical protein